MIEILEILQIRMPLLSREGCLRRYVLLGFYGISSNIRTFR